jgi:hypothetical protein
MPRTLREKAIDSFLTIFVIDDAFSRANLQILPSTKLQKLVFLSEKAMIDEHAKGFNLRFIKLIHGPYSQELETDAGRLVQYGLIQDMTLEPTKNAKYILDDFHRLIERNEPFFQSIQRVNERYAGMPLQRLLKIVYAMPWGRSGKTIADLPQRTPMLYPMKPEAVEHNFVIKDKEAEDLLMNFDAEAIRDLSDSMRDAREGKWRTYEQVFSDV